MAQSDMNVDGWTTKVPPLNREDGTTFGWDDRWHVGLTPDGKNITDFADWEARDLSEMLRKDYKARQMESVLTLPIVSAERSVVGIKGDTGEKEWLEEYWGLDHLSGGSRTTLDQIIDRSTSAFQYKRAFFEKVFRRGTGDFDGKIVYDDLAWRPQTTCRLMRDVRTGRYSGFEQEPYYIGPEIRRSKKKWPIQIPRERAFVFTHGTRRDPVNGTSEMEIAYWAYRTKQKILLLWFQFLQSVSLPRVVVKANDGGVAAQVAQQIANMKSSGVLPVSMPGGPQSVDITVLDQSGKGAEQFTEVITWLDNCATQSILAGFLNLSNRGMPVDGVGSFALSKDASNFYLQSEEARARELEDQVRSEVFAPLIYHNFGRDAKVPKLAFEPLNDIDKGTSVTLLQAAMAAPPGGPIPVDFIAALAEQVSNYVGLDGPKMHVAFRDSFNAAADEAKAAAAQQSAAGASPLGQKVAGVAGAVNAAKNAAAAKKAPGGKNARTFAVPQKPPAPAKPSPVQQAAADAKKAAVVPRKPPTR